MRGRTWVAAGKCTAVAPDQAINCWVPVPGMSECQPRTEEFEVHTCCGTSEWSTLVSPAFLSVLEATTQPSSTFSFHLR